MINVEKVVAVRKYLSLEFPGLEIRDHYDSGRMAQCFEIGPERTCFKAILAEKFFEDHDEGEIAPTLKGFLLVEHLRECDYPVIVTNEGLKID
ncbi:MAG: hypothetical protein ABSE08_13220 [Syntrophobacteraceae bacterium]|jgi:hypothetical protein